MSSVGNAAQTIRHTLLKDLSIDLPVQLSKKAQALVRVVKMHGDHFRAAAAQHATDPAKRDLFGSAIALMKTFFTKFGMSEERYLKLAEHARKFVSTLLKLPEDFSKQEFDVANKSMGADIKASFGRMSQHLKNYIEADGVKVPEAAVKV